MIETVIVESFADWDEAMWDQRQTKYVFSFYLIFTVVYIIKYR